MHLSQVLGPSRSSKKSSLSVCRQLLRLWPSVRWHGRPGLKLQGRYGQLCLQSWPSLKYFTSTRGNLKFSDVIETHYEAVRLLVSSSFTAGIHTNGKSRSGGGYPQDFVQVLGILQLPQWSPSSGSTQCTARPPCLPKICFTAIFQDQTGWWTPLDPHLPPKFKRCPQTHRTVCHRSQPWTSSSCHCRLGTSSIGDLSGESSECGSNHGPIMLTNPWHWHLQSLALEGVQALHLVERFSFDDQIHNTSPCDKQPRNKIRSWQTPCQTPSPSSALVLAHWLELNSILQLGVARLLAGSASVFICTLSFWRALQIPTLARITNPQIKRWYHDQALPFNRNFPTLALECWQLPLKYPGVAQHPAIDQTLYLVFGIQTVFSTLCD